MIVAILDQPVQSSQGARGKIFAHPRLAAAAHALTRREPKNIYFYILYYILLYFITFYGRPALTRDASLAATDVGDGEPETSRRPAGGLLEACGPGGGQGGPAHKAGSERPA